MSRVLENGKNQITKGYNPITHKGIDLVKYKSQLDYIIAHTEGIVVWIQKYPKNNKNAKGNETYGNCVKLKHPNGYYTLYAHMKFLDVKLKEKVEKGQRLGYMGESGRAFGCHLHFEVRNEKDKRINPTPYIDSDLPSVDEKYQTYDNVKNKWLPYVKVGTNKYAGNLGNGVSGFRLSKYPYKSYDLVKKRWLPEVTGLSDYAGNLTNNMGGIAINGDGKIKYRCHTKNGKWLPWVTGYNTKDHENGYAGNLQKTIDAIQVAEI